MHKMWRHHDSATPPREVKVWLCVGNILIRFSCPLNLFIAQYTISKFAPQFSGYQQHDSQELTGFMLDALHEGT